MSRKKQNSTDQEIDCSKYKDSQHATIVPASSSTDNIQVAGFFRQLRILLWKNSLLFRRNIFGTLCEILLSIGFVMIILLIRYIIESVQYKDQSNPFYNVIDYFQNFAGHYIILYYPDTPVVQQIVQNAFFLIKSRKPWLNATIQATTVSDATKLDSDMIQKLIALISFPDDYNQDLPNNVEYTIYTQELTSFQYHVDSTFYNKLDYMFGKSPEYYCMENRYFRLYNVFNALKHAVDLSVIQVMSSIQLSDPRMVRIQQLDCPGYQRDELKALFAFFTPLVISIAFMFTLVINIGNLVTEKQSKIKDYLSLVGVKTYINWLAWLIRSMIIYFILSVLITTVGVIELAPRKNDTSLVTKSLFTYTNFTVIFTTCIVYSIQVTVFTLLLSQIFNKPFIAKICSIIFWLLTTINFYDGLPSSTYKYLFCVFPNAALNFATQVIFQFERSGKRLSYGNLFTNLFDDPLTLGAVLLAMLVWTVLYLPVIWYLEKVIPGKFGIALPFYFPLMPSYWIRNKTLRNKIFCCFNRNKIKHEHDSIDEESEKSYDVSTDSSNDSGLTSSTNTTTTISTISSIEMRNTRLIQDMKTTIKRASFDSKPSLNYYETNKHFFEPEPAHLKATVKMNNITKKFRSGFKKKVAVNNLSINFYENQITSLLGHNGAGKTTTIFMLCGMFEPSSGQATIFDFDIRKDMNKIYSMIGFCPQEDIQYSDLTVHEHLELIAAIKGFTGKSLAEEVKRIATFIGLKHDLHKRSKQLSGGMRRRLSVGMALTGNSKIIILDEPTSGLDPFNRRSLWQLIQKYKTDRTIILTTHFMEEADALSDRIAIMSNGEIKCAGSAAFLKSKYGIGFRLKMVKDMMRFNDDYLINSVINHKKLLRNSSNYFIESNTASEFIMKISNSCEHLLPKLLNKLEKHKSKIGIESYGISSPTIEEVFLKVSQINDSSNRSVGRKSVSASQDSGNGLVIDLNSDYSSDYALAEPEKLSNVFNKEYRSATGFKRFLQQLIALLLKRFWIFIRRYILACVVLFMPVILEIMFCFLIPSQTYLINQLGGTVKHTGTVKLDMNNYGPNRFVYTLNDSRYNQIPVRSLLKNFYVPSRRPFTELVEIQSNNVSGFILDLRKRDVKNIVNDFYFGMNLNIMSPSQLQATLYYSTLAFSSSATLVNEVANLLLAYVTNDFNKSITTYNTPLTSNDSLYTGNDFLEYLACMDVLPVSLINMVNSIIVAFIISIMVINVARERVNGSKCLQLITGTKSYVYWLANYIFDVTICLFNIGTMIVALKIVDIIKDDPTNETHPLSQPSTLGYVFLLLLVSSFSWCTMAYIWSFFFKSEIISFIVLAIILGVFSFVDMLCSFIQLFFQIDSPGETTATSKVMVAFRYIFAILFPNVTVKRGLYNLKIRENTYCINSLNLILNTELNLNESFLSFNEPGIGMLLLFCVIQFVAGNFIIYLLEMKEKLNIGLSFRNMLSRLCIKFPFACCKRFQKGPEYIQTHMVKQLEEDVKNEYERIACSNLDSLKLTEKLIVHSIFKKYRKKRKNYKVVKHLSFGVKPKECFGLLGLNGAGKTTLLKMLIGEVKPTSGNAYINGFDIHRSYAKSRLSLGYCPQYDYLPEYLTVQQTFELFSDLKGLEKSRIPDVIDDLTNVFKLNQFKHRQIQNLSGGNKRKLSSALSFLGRPSVVILDEPTTGMDPGSRRYFWNVIKQAKNFGMTIILTSHSMEECETLCSKLGIMVSGQFQCYGTLDHIKSKYGRGFSLDIKCKRQSEPTNDRSIVEEFIRKHIPNAQLKDKQQDTLVYQIDDQKLSEQTLSKRASTSSSELVLDDVRLQTRSKSPRKHSHKRSKASIASLFSLLEANKTRLNIESYSLTQTNLEQVFLLFAESQHKRHQKKKLRRLHRLRRKKERSNSIESAKHESKSINLVNIDPNNTFSIYKFPPPAGDTYY